MQKRTFSRTPGTLAKVPNEGNVFQIITVNNKPCIMINGKYYTDGESAALHKLETYKVHTAQLQTVPTNCYTQIKTSTGGLGKHIRWRILNSKQENDKTINILIGLFDRTTTEFEAHLLRISQLVTTRETPISYVDCENYIQGKRINNVCALQTQTKNLQYVAAYLLYLNYYFEVENDSDLTQSTLVCERLDRSEQMWVYQCKKDADQAGPLRKNTNWKQNFTPWSEVIFTWKTLSKYVMRDIESNNKLNIYPEPLQTYIKKTAQGMNEEKCSVIQKEYNEITKKIKQINIMSVYVKYKKLVNKLQCLQNLKHEQIVELYKNISVINYKLKVCLNTLENLKYNRLMCCSEEYNLKNIKYSTNHLFMNKLTDEQMVQLLSAYWFHNIGPCDEEMSHICKLILFAYFLHGYYVRTIGDYRPTAENVGKSDTIRPLSREEYQRAKLPIEVINRIYRKNGEWKGSGFRGSKGRHAPPPGVPIYQPTKRRKRVDITKIKSQQKPYS